MDCKNEQGYTTTYYSTPANAIFTLNGNNKSIGNTKDSAPCCFLVNRGEVTLNNCTFNDNKVELKGGTTTIEGCTFNSSVTLSGGGGFNDTADVNSGTFKGEVTIQSGYVRIMGGTFEQAVTIKSGKGYTINAGLFQGVVTAESGAVLKIYAGIFCELTAALGGSEGVVLWGGTYDKVTNQGNAAALLGGYTDGTGGAAYVDAADNTKFKNAEAAAQSTLTCVKVIRHTHSVDETTGTCACGESFMASVNNGTSVTGYKTLAAALDAVKIPSANAQDATKYIVKVYKDVAEDVSITGGKFTLDLNGKSVGDLDTADRTAFTVSGTPAATVNGGEIYYMTIQAGTVELTGNVTVGHGVEVSSGSVLAVRGTAQSGEPVFNDVVTIQNGGKLVASAGTFDGVVEFKTGAEGELSGGTYGNIECGSEQLLRDMLKTGYAFFADNQLVNGYVTSLTRRTA